MRFIAEFWRTLTAPEEWHTASIAAVGAAAALLLGALFGEAFDAQF